MRKLLAALLLALTVAGVAAETPGSLQHGSVHGTARAYFTPWDDVEGELLRMLAEARHTVYVQAYLFSSKSLARRLVEVAARGVKVRLLADAEMVRKGENSQIPWLAANGIEVALETRYAAAHNKVILIDPERSDGVAVTGSYNFTYSAQHRNAENVLIIRGNPELLKAYLHNWRRHRGDAQPYTPDHG